MPDNWITCEKCGLEIREVYRDTHEKKSHSAERYESPWREKRSSVSKSPTVEHLTIDAQGGRRKKGSFECYECSATVGIAWKYSIVKPTSQYSHRTEKIGELFLCERCKSVIVTWGMGIGLPTPTRVDGDYERSRKRR